ncbi:unnamed protein product [Closterium sp. NIES-54]
MTPASPPFELMRPHPPLPPFRSTLCPSPPSPPHPQLLVSWLQQHTLTPPATIITPTPSPDPFLLLFPPPPPPPPAASPGGAAARLGGLRRLTHLPPPLPQRLLPHQACSSGALRACRPGSGAWLGTRWQLRGRRGRGGGGRRWLSVCGVHGRD